MIELSLIKLLLTKEHWLSASSQGLSIRDLPKELHPLFSALSTYYAVNDDPLSVDDLGNLVFASTNKDKEFNQGLLDNLKQLDVSQTTSQTLLSGMLQKKRLKELSLAAYEAYEGRLEMEKFLPLIESFDATPEAIEDDEDEFVTDNIEELVNTAVNTPGLSWRLNTLNRMLGPLRDGKAGFIFARPETGKSTFLGSEIPFMAEQTERDILVFANEDDGPDYKLRFIQGTFGITMEQLLSNTTYWQAEYDKLIQGRIKLKAAGVIRAATIDKLVAKYKPALVVIDQLAHIEGFSEDKKHLAYGRAYRWAREIAKGEHCSVISVHQAGGEGEGVMKLTMNHVDEVKTAAQAHADWILGIGKSNKDGYDSIRGLHLSKNKLVGGPQTIPSLRHGFQEVLIKPEVCRYEDLY